MTLVKSKFKFYFQLYTFNTTTVPDKPSRVSFVNAFATPVDFRPFPFDINYFGENKLHCWYFARS